MVRALKDGAILKMAKIGNENEMAILQKTLKRIPCFRNGKEMDKMHIHGKKWVSATKELVISLGPFSAFCGLQ